MKRHLTYFILLSLMVLAACHKSDDDIVEPDPPQPKAARVEMMTIFAPGQLGDGGYADRVMKGVILLENSTADSLDVDFIASYDVPSTQQSIKSWMQSDTTSKYSRRLLVLTEVFMANWVAEFKDLIPANMEILLLKANSEDVASAAKITGLDSRTYGLNISAASAVRHYLEARQFFFENVDSATPDHSIIVTRLYSDKVTIYRDSIIETLGEDSSINLSGAILDFTDNEGELFSSEYQMTAFEYAYSATSMFREISETFNAPAFFGVFDYAAAAKGADIFIMSNNADFYMKVLMLDAEPNVETLRFCATRHFDTALDKWVTDWLGSIGNTMPSSTTHGGWDGYCTDDIDKNLFIYYY